MAFKSQCSIRRCFDQRVNKAIKITMGMGTPSSKSMIERIVSLLQF
jgi:hypothetical protein